MIYKDLKIEQWTDKIQVYNGDCMDLLAATPDNYFSLCICDPPYGIGAASMNMGLGNTPKASKAKNRKWKSKDWDDSIPNDEYFKELFRVSKNQIIWGGNYFDLPPCSNFIIWDKEIPQGLSFSDCEYAWTSFKGANKMFRYSAYKNKEHRIHPTQKPVALYNWILDRYAKPDFKILDTHLGSGSHAISCHHFGCELVAAELDTDYYNDSHKRFILNTAQQKLF